MALVQDRIIEFISYQVQRSQMKLFCEMNDIHVSWKKISRGVPRGRQAANDRAPTREEIERLLQYPDRRIKPIVFTMISSGIRIGAWDFLKWKLVKPFHDKTYRFRNPFGGEGYYCNNINKCPSFGKVLNISLTRMKVKPRPVKGAISNLRDASQEVIIDFISEDKE